jgi:hypothetical protein
MIIESTDIWLVIRFCLEVRIPPVTYKFAFFITIILLWQSIHAGKIFAVGELTYTTQGTRKNAGKSEEK